MITIGKIKNRFIITLLFCIVVLIIGLLDYITGAEISFSIFFLMPIPLVALYKIQKNDIRINAVFVALFWFSADFYDRDILIISSPFGMHLSYVPFFLIIGLSALKLKVEYKIINC